MIEKINKTLLSISAIIAGVAVALFIVYPLLLLAGLLGFSDSEVGRSFLLLHYTFLLLTGLVSGFVAGFISNKVYSSSLYLHPVVAALILAFLWLLVNDFDLQHMSRVEKIMIPVILMGALIAARLSGRNRR